MNLSIKEIAIACEGTLVLKEGCDENTLVDSVVLDSRLVTEGGVFVATVGEKVDGHKFIPDVFAKGVILAITRKTPEEVEKECGVPGASWGSYVLVEDTLTALRKIGEFYRSKLKTKIVGITGSVGKTSTKEFVAGVLAEKYCVYKTQGNFNNEIGVPLTLLKIRDRHEVAVVEMGISDFGEMHRLSKMARPDICVITNIGQCHLENLKSREGILRAKTEIFDFMAADGEVCLNGEDDMLRTVKREKAPHFFGLGETTGQEVWADEVKSRGLFGSSAKMHLEAGAEAFEVEIPLPGKHMVTNAAAACMVAKLLGLTAEEMARGLSKLQAVDGRGHLIRLPDYTIIDDCYNANPVSMKASLDLLGMADTAKVAILGDMFELGDHSLQMHGQVGSYAVSSGIDYLFCVGEHSRVMYEEAVKAATEKAADKKPTILYFPRREELLKVLQQQELLPRGCTILVKASHGMKFAEIIEYLKTAP